MRFEADPLFWVIAGAMVLILGYRLLKYGSVQAALFGADVKYVTFEMDVESAKLKLCVLEPADRTRGPHVGMEVTHSTAASWESIPISLTRDQAIKLAEALTRAAERSIPKG